MMLDRFAWHGIQFGLFPGVWILFVILIIVLIVLCIIFIVKLVGESQGDAPVRDKTGKQEVLRILEKRLANGEINEDEFMRIKNLLMLEHDYEKGK